MSKYIIVVNNRQGAWYGYAADTKQAIESYLDSWNDPENLQATVRDINGDIVAYKNFGRKTIPWSIKAVD